MTLSTKANAVTDQDIAAQTGVKCSECKKAVNLLASPPPGFSEDDKRLGKLFSCGTLPSWKWMHADLVHECVKHAPVTDEARVYPLPGRDRKQMLDQEATDVSNEMMSAKAIAVKLSNMEGADRIKLIAKIKAGSPAHYAKMAESLYDEILTVRNAPKILAARRAQQKAMTR